MRARYQNQDTRPRHQCHLQAALDSWPGKEEPPNLESLLVPAPDLLVSKILPTPRIRTSPTATSTRCPICRRPSLPPQQSSLFACDLPAAKKMIGKVSHSSATFPCHHCPITAAQLQTADAFEPESLPESRWKEGLDAAFEFKTASPTRQKELTKSNGVTYSPLIKLIGFNHCWTAPPDPMHNTFLGISRAWFAMIMNSELFVDTGLDDFREVFATAEYPTHLVRLPVRIIEQLTRPKDSVNGRLIDHQLAQRDALSPLRQILRASFGIGGGP